MNINKILLARDNYYLALKNLSKIINKLTNRNPSVRPAMTSLKKWTPSHSLERATMKIIKPKSIFNVIRQKWLLT